MKKVKTKVSIDSSFNFNLTVSQFVLSVMTKRTWYKSPNLIMRRSSLCGWECQFHASSQNRITSTIPCWSHVLSGGWVFCISNPPYCVYIIVRGIWWLCILTGKTKHNWSSWWVEFLCKSICQHLDWSSWNRHSRCAAFQMGRSVAEIFSVPQPITMPGRAGQGMAGSPLERKRFPRQMGLGTL